jgi:hypothetical protein
LARWWRTATDGGHAIRVSRKRTMIELSSREEVRAKEEKGPGCWAEKGWAGGDLAGW